MNAKEINDKYIMLFNNQISSVGISYKTLADISGIEYKTIMKIFKESRYLSYGNAVILYDVLFKGKKYSALSSKKRRDKVVKNFYKNFNSKYEEKSYTLLGLEKETGISHSTLYTYRKELKKPRLCHAIILSQYMQFDLYDIC